MKVDEISRFAPHPFAFLSYPLPKRKSVLGEIEIYIPGKVDFLSLISSQYKRPNLNYKYKLIDDLFVAHLCNS